MSNLKRKKMRTRRAVIFCKVECRKLSRRLGVRRQQNVQTSLETYSKFGRRWSQNNDTK